MLLVMQKVETFSAYLDFFSKVFSVSCRSFCVLLCHVFHVYTNLDADNRKLFMPCVISKKEDVRNNLLFNFF